MLCNFLKNDNQKKLWQKRKNSPVAQKKRMVQSTAVSSNKQLEKFFEEFSKRHLLHREI